MVMSATLFKNALREIKNRLGRFISITCIVALGVGFFAGMKIVLPDLTLTADTYYNDTHFLDFQLMCDYGYDDDSVKTASDNKQISAVEGVYSADAIFTFNSADNVLKTHSISKNINTLSIKYGKNATDVTECVVDARLFDESYIGTTLKLAKTNNSETLEKFKYTEYTIVGIADSPLYLNYERGTSKLGDGTILGFVYILPECYDYECFTELYLKTNCNAQIYSDEYEDYIEKITPDIETLSQTIATDRFNKIKADAEDEYNDGYLEYTENLNKFKNEKADAESELQTAYNKLKDGENELKKGKADYQKSFEDYQNGVDELDKSKAQLQSAIQSVDDGIAQINLQLPQIDNAINSLEQLPTLNAENSAKLVALKSQREQMTAKQGELQATKSQLLKEQSQVDLAQAQLNSAKSQLETAKIELDNAEKELKSGWNEYYDGKNKADKEFADAEKKLLDAENKLKDAREDIDGIKKPNDYALDRRTNIGYVCFENDSAIVEGLASVFPIFFFLIAALMCMTTMKRMVEEQRTDIGTLKALGYSTAAILSKYIIYAALAGVIGTVIGFFMFSVLFPYVLWIAYEIMYSFSPIMLTFDYAVGGGLLIVALICTVGSTVLSCYSTLLESAASILRPKVLKSGKHAFFENFSIFKRLKFLRKVSIRNLTRYKQRFAMMVIGIGGCTALLITGFGVRDSILNLADLQFGKIQRYDYAISLTDDAKSDSFDKVVSSTDIEDAILLHSLAYDIKGSKGMDTATVIAYDGDNLKDFISLTLDKNPISYPKNDEAVVSKKFADNNGIKIGDEISVIDSDNRCAKLKVLNFCDNYIDSFVYTSVTALESGFGVDVVSKTIFANCKENSDINAVSAQLMSNDSEIVNITTSSGLFDRIFTMFEAFDYVIVLVIFCAGSLAFVVLYNLTNINITERIREIATIKVLGFYNNETASYVFGENLILTGFGAVAGVFMGKALHAFVMKKVEVNKISFDVTIEPLSFIFAIALTFLFAILIDMFMVRKIKNIDMAQSLKSIE